MKPQGKPKPKGTVPPAAKRPGKKPVKAGAPTRPPTPKHAGESPRASPPRDDHNAKMAEASRERSSRKREIGPPDHSGRDVVRWDSCRFDFELFCRTYLPEWFPLPFSGDHRKAIKKIEAAVLRGERLAFAMPRGSGKTTLCQAAAIWAMLYGHRRFVVLIGASSEAAVELLAEIMEELEVNDDLYDDFNEVCRYIRALEGIAQRANGQTASGERTRIEWTGNLVRFPAVPGSPSEGSIIKVAGITGRIRGMKVGGKRPDLAIVDDPQTDESASSLTQIRSREKAMGKAVLGLAGPKVQIAALCPCTVIAPGDLADRVLDNARHPRWNGERFKMVYAFPLNTELWTEYARLLADVGGEKAAAALYRANRKEMDRGAVIAWPERFPEGKLSAIQHAMDLLIDNRGAFMAEAQNEPELDQLDGEIVELDAAEIAAKVNMLSRGVVPRDCNRVTAGIDVQGGCHFAVLTAWDSTFGGSVIDYLAFPKQRHPFFTNATANPGLADQFRGEPEEVRVYMGLSALCALIMSRTYRQEETGAELPVELCLIDSGRWTKEVYQFCRRSQFKDRLKPSKGRGIKAGDKPIDEYRTDPKRDQTGYCWRIGSDTPERHVLFDTNAWKSMVAARLNTKPPVAGCLTLNGSDPREHELFALHMTAEYQTETSGYGRTLREWKWRPERNDNHWWDALILSAVAASVRGVKWDTAAAAGDHAATAPAKALMKLSEVQKLKRQEKRGRRTS